MGKFLVFILLCFPALSYGQGFAALGNGNPLDTARIFNNYFLPMKKMRLPAYATADSNFLLIMPNSGVPISYSIGSLISRISAITSIPTLQQVLTAGNIITTQSEIQLQQSLNFTGASNLIVTAPMLKTSSPIAYAVEFSYGNLDVPTYGAVKTYVSESSFDYNVTTTITSLTDARFARTLSYIIYAGMTYNSNYFTQVGTTITFVGLTFFNGQKLTFQLK